MVHFRWTTFLRAERQCPRRRTLVEPQLREAESSGTRGCEHCCTLRQFGRTGRSNVGQSFPRRPDECPIHVDDGIDQRGKFQEEVRRRRFARWPVTKKSRYGMRGCRIGEASNPGPPTQGVSEVVVESLEQVLTALDTDAAPQVRAITGRHVICRVGEQSSEFSSTRLESFDEASMQLVPFLLLPVLVSHAFCTSSVQGAPPPSPLASPSSHQADLRVWPSSRLFWPPPRSVHQRGCVGSPRFRFGVRRGSCVS